VNLKPKIEKNIFQVRYKPTLSFYDKLYKGQEIFSIFPHWQTDRLKITLRDFDKKHSITIKHDKLTFETDKHNKKSSDEISRLISNNIDTLTTKEDITRLGSRSFCLVPLDMEFPELVEILNMKLFSSDFINLMKEKPNDNSITFTSKYNEYHYRIQMGPIKNVEIPNFIRFNIENHVDQNSNSKYTELANLVENYPETSLFIDIDISLHKTTENLNVLEFYTESNKIYKEVTQQLIEYIFKNKI
jgi:hypothetical protein